MQEIPKSKRGFTLIETVITMVILGICLTPLSILIVNVMSQNARSQAWATAVYLAEGQTERVEGLRFSAVNCEGPTAFSPPFGIYSYQVFVDYVNANTLDTSVGQPSLCASPGGTITDYKRVRVQVSRTADNIIEPISVVSLSANDW